MALWKINCMEDQFPGMWHQWFLHQCVAAGWGPGNDGYSLTGPVHGDKTWSRARNILQTIEIGDFVVAALKHHRVGRLGEITRKAIGDDEWNPFVPPNKDYPSGEMGRRLLVRWDMTVGPDDRDMIVSLPKGSQFAYDEFRHALSSIKSITLADLKKTMRDERNWVGLSSHFSYERALSDYLATYPHRLEDGLLPHPNKKVRERVFEDKSRLDVLLLDRNLVSVIVECKQNQPTVADVHQLRGYLRNLEKETRSIPRGILVHGGSRKIHREIQIAANVKPKIEIIQYKLDVGFAQCN